MEYHTQLAKMSFDEIFDLTAGVHFNFYNILFELFTSVSRLRRAPFGSIKVTPHPNSTCAPSLALLCVRVIQYSNLNNCDLTDSDVDDLRACFEAAEDVGKIKKM